MTEHREKHPFRRAKVVIFDIDDTLYNQTLPMQMAAGVAFCGAVTTQLGASCTLDNQAIIAAGMKAHKAERDAYRDRESCSGADPRQVHAHMHRLWRELEQKNPSIQRNETLRQMLLEMKRQGVQLFAYSDAHAEWSRHVLTELGVSDLFPEPNLVTRDALPGFKTKSKGTEGFEKIKQLSGSEYSEMVFVDDCREHLANAKKLGITTVLNDQRQESKEPVEPDYRYNSVPAFIREFLQHRVVRYMRDHQSAATRH